MLPAMRRRLSIVLPLAVLVGCADATADDLFRNDEPPPPPAAEEAAATSTGGSLITIDPPAGGTGGSSGGAAGISLQQGGAGPAGGGSAGIPPIDLGGAAGSAGGAIPPVPTTEPTSVPPYIPPPGALPDIQFEMQSEVPPGGETLMCMYAAMPTDRGVIAVPSAESRFTPGSHHLLAYRTDLTAIPQGQTGVWACRDGSWMVHQKGSYYEAQQPESRRDLPPGVAHRFAPGEVVILQTHYLNPATDVLLAHAQLTLHTVELSAVPNEAGSIIFTDVNISIPAGGKSRSTMTCTLPTDFNPALLWSHMHKQGSNFIATTDDPVAATTLGTLYQENDWEEPHPRTYPFNPPVTLHAGTHITFSCDFMNPTSTTITFGQSAETNEMCILHGMYWPRMTASAEQCSGGKTSRTAIP
jgi:hypothetical protein